MTMAGDTGRAWLAALPGELEAQRRVMTGLVDCCENWPQATSLLVGCSLGRGAADALSDIDAALGVDAPRGEAGAGVVGCVEAMIVAALPDLGTVVDVLRHRTGPVGQHVRRIFAQFADGTQLDLAVVAQAEIEAGCAAAAPRTSSRCTRRPGRRPPTGSRGRRGSRQRPRPRTRSPAIRSGSGPFTAGAR